MAVSEVSIVVVITSADSRTCLVVEMYFILFYLESMPMPAFDPVRDAVLNSPVQRRATDLSVLLNQDSRNPPPPRQSSIHSLLSPQDDTLATLEPIRRSSMDINHISPPASRRESVVDSSRPSTADSAAPRSTQSPVSLPYNPRNRISKPDSVLIPLSREEIEKYKNFRGEGAARLLSKRKRAASEEPDPEERRPNKRHVGDVGVVVEHCKYKFIIFFYFAT